MVALGPAREHALPIGLAPAEEGLVVDEAVLGDLRVAGPDLAHRQGVEERGVGDHQARLMEGAHEVLAVGGVDPGLAADRGIDLGEQGGRDLHEAHAAADHRGREAGEVPDHAAPERDHEVAALDPGRQDRVADLREAGVALGRLARRHGHDSGPQAGVAERLREACRVERAHVLVRHDRGRPRPEGRDPLGRAGEEPPSDQDLVGAVAEGHRHGDGGGGVARGRDGDGHGRVILAGARPAGEGSSGEGRRRGAVRASRACPGRARTRAPS
jgi:hypothetical protein